MKTIYLNGEVSSYKIDSDGVVYGKRGKINPIKWGVRKNRYMYSFNHKGGKIRILSNRLVATYCLDWVPDNPSDYQVNHKNGNTLDDRPENLEWVSGKENIKHAYETGLSSGSCYRQLRVFRDGEHVGDFESLYRCAKTLGLNPGNVHTVVKKNADGKRHTLRGYYIVEVVKR